MMVIAHEQFSSDEFFTATQQRHLGELMARWRVARDAGQMLPTEEQMELEGLIEAELAASAKRAERLIEKQCIR